MGSGYNYRYFYDNKNRLDSAITSLPGATESYTYSDDGSILTKNRTGNNINYTYAPGKHRLERVIINGSDSSYYSYDLKGNIYGGDGILMSYNFRNQPVEMINMNMEKYNYTYNSNGERTKKVMEADTSGEYYLRDYLGRELVIYDYQSGDIKAANIFGNGLIGRIEFQESTDERFYYLKDHLGSIRATLNQYSTVVSAQDYFPYGETIRNYVYGMPIEKYKFNGKERDVESGLDNSVWRYYMSRLGLWPQIDPLSDKYPGLSPYNYALNNPTRYVDPRGASAKDKEQQDDIDPLFYLLKDRQDGTVDNNKQVTASEVEDTKAAYYAAAGIVNTMAGGAVTVGEHSLQYSNTFFRALQSEYSSIYYGLDFTPEIAKTAKSIGLAKTVGGSLFFVGTMISGLEFASDPTLTQGLESAADIGIGAITTYGGPPGLVIGGTYYGVKYSIGWGNVYKSQLNIDVNKQKYGYPLGGLR